MTLEPKTFAERYGIYLAFGLLILAPFLWAVYLEIEEMNIFKDICERSGGTLDHKTIVCGCPQGEDIKYSQDTITRDSGGITAGMGCQYE